MYVAIEGSGAHDKSPFSKMTCKGVVSSFPIFGTLEMPATVDLAVVQQWQKGKSLKHARMRNTRHLHSRETANAIIM